MTGSSPRGRCEITFHTGHRQHGNFCALYDHPDDILKAYGIPAGLADRVYASWVGALGAPKPSPSMDFSSERYDFCCGYTQALQDSGVLEPYLCRFLQAQDILVDVQTSLHARGI